MKFVQLQSSHKQDAALSSLSYSDYSNQMHTFSNLPRAARWIPPFVFSEENLRRVLLVRAWRYVHGQKPVPEEINMAEIDKAATARALEHGKGITAVNPLQHAWAKTHVDAVRRAGSFLALESAIVFRAYRLGQDSPTIGDGVDLTPWAVRQHLNRTLRIARQLGFDCGAPHHSKGKPKVLRFSVSRIREMLEAGKSQTHVAARFGIPRQTLKGRARKAGILQ
jgi:hypothetical protein